MHIRATVPLRNWPRGQLRNLPWGKLRYRFVTKVAAPAAKRFALQLVISQGTYEKLQHVRARPFGNTCRNQIHLYQYDWIAAR